MCRERDRECTRESERAERERETERERVVETYFQEGYLYQFEQHATTQAKLAANVRAVLLWQGLSCLRFRRKEVGGPAQRGWESEREEDAC